MAAVLAPSASGLGPGAPYDSLAVQGSVAVLAASGQLSIFDISKGGAPVKALQLGKRKLTSKVQLSFNSLTPEGSIMASSLNNELLVWDLAQETPYRTFNKAKKPLTSVDWSWNDPNFVAATSDERSTQIYDLRHSKPCMSLATQGGATQARWSRFNAHILATAQPGRVRLWDTRTRSVLSNIMVPSQRIRSLDWSPIDPDQLVTCVIPLTAAEDQVVLWSHSQSDKPLGSIRGSSNMLQATFTPFGRGLITSAAPPRAAPHEAIISMWSCDQILSSENADELVNLRGNSDYGWRNAIDSSGSHFEIITRDARGLCATPLSADVNIALGYNTQATRTTSGRSGVNSALSGGVLSDGSSSSFASGRNSGAKAGSSDGAAGRLDGASGAEARAAGLEDARPQSLAAEFHRVRRLSVPFLHVSTVDAASRQCSFSIVIQSDGGVKVVAKFSASFPSQYPNGVAPVFHVVPSPLIRLTLRQQLLEELDVHAQQAVSQGKPCLELCIRRAIELLQRAFKPKQRGSKLYDALKAQKASAQMDMQRAPPSCGAHFSATGLLITFTNRALVSSSAEGSDGRARRGVTARATGTARPGPAPAAASGVPPAKDAAPPPPASRSRSMLLPKLLFRPVAPNSAPLDAAVITDSKKHVPGKVEMIDVSKLTLSHRHLCRDYKLSAEGMSAHSACLFNARLARQQERRDLAQAWSLAAQVLSPLVLQRGEESINSPCGGGLLNQLLRMYHERQDTQTVAAIASLVADARAQGDHGDHAGRDLLHKDMKAVVVAHMRAYADILAAHGLLIQAAEMNKAQGVLVPVESKPEQDPFARSAGGTGGAAKESWSSTGPSGTNDASDSGRLYTFSELRQRDRRRNSSEEDADPVPDPRAITPRIQCEVRTIDNHSAAHSTALIKKAATLACAVCRLKAREFTLCPRCGHGGHFEHLMLWFACEASCPSGCGCFCRDMEYNLTESSAQEEAME